MTERAESIQIVASMTRRRNAPKSPTKSTLERLFLAAWENVPARRRPALLGLRRANVDIFLVGDTEIAEMNIRHMHHEGPTDVLSFPMGEADPEKNALHIGDVIVSFETAEREATARAISTEEEISRYCVHGFLHCLGYDDSTAARRKKMFAVQEQVLKAIFNA